MTDQPTPPAPKATPPSEKADAIEANMGVDFDAWQAGVNHAQLACEATITDLRAQLAAKEAELKAFQSVQMQIVPGENGEGVEVPATPESLRASIAYFMREWDGAEGKAGEAEAENAELKAALNVYRTHEALTTEQQKPAEEALCHPKQKTNGGSELVDKLKLELAELELRKDRERLVAALESARDAFIKYEMNVDEEAPWSHRKLMEQIAAALAPSTQEKAP